MAIIPTPEQARELRVAYEGNPIIDELEIMLRERGADDALSAAELLQTLLTRHLLAVTPREREAAIARFITAGGAQ